MKYYSLIKKNYLWRTLQVYFIYYYTKYIQKFLKIYNKQILNILVILNLKKAYYFDIYTATFFLMENFNYP